MRRKSFDVLFEPKLGMAELAKKPTMWRSLFYFVISMGAFIGVITNVIFADQSIAVRFAILLGFLLIKLIALACYGCFLHGLSDICGAPGGDIRSFLCILGFTTLPYLVLTPIALLGVRFGGIWLLLIPIAGLIGLAWWFFLVVRALQVVYLINFFRAAAIVAFSLFLLMIILFMPFYLGTKMIVLKLG